MPDAQGFEFAWGSPKSGHNCAVRDTFAPSWAGRRHQSCCLSALGYCYSRALLRRDLRQGQYLTRAGGWWTGASHGRIAVDVGLVAAVGGGAGAKGGFVMKVGRITQRGAAVSRLWRRSGPMVAAGCCGLLSGGLGGICDPWTDELVDTVPGPNGRVARGVGLPLHPPLRRNGGEIPWIGRRNRLRRVNGPGSWIKLALRRPH